MHVLRKIIWNSEHAKMHSFILTWFNINFY